MHKGGRYLAPGEPTDTIELRARLPRAEYNADAFDRLLADRLKESGRKVAYLMVDALRYELGVALAQLTSLVPGDLRRARDDDALVPLVRMAAARLLESRRPASS